MSSRFNYCHKEYFSQLLISTNWNWWYLFFFLISYPARYYTIPGLRFMGQHFDCAFTSPPPTIVGNGMWVGFTRWGCLFVYIYRPRVNLLSIRDCFREITRTRQRKWNSYNTLISDKWPGSVHFVYTHNAQIYGMLVCTYKLVLFTVIQFLCRFHVWQFVKDFYKIIKNNKRKEKVLFSWYVTSDSRVSAIFLLT